MTNPDAAVTAVVQLQIRGASAVVPLDDGSCSLVYERHAQGVASCKVRMDCVQGRAPIYKPMS